MMVTNNPVERLLDLTVTMHEHALSGEWEQLRTVDDQRTQLLKDAISQNLIMPQKHACTQQILDLQTKIVNLAIAERERLSRDFQQSRAKIQTSNYYLGDGSATRPHKPPVSAVGKEVN